MIKIFKFFPLFLYRWIKKSVACANKVEKEYDAINSIFENQTNLDPEFSKIVSNNFWDLMQ